MPITINGTGTVTGISAGGLPDGVITTDDIAANAVTFGKIGTTEQSQLCKAWVNFNGTGTVTIRAAYNVSSITDLGTGSYRVNFSTAFADSYYAVSTGFQANVGWPFSMGFLNNSTTSVELYSFSSSTATDAVQVTAAFFR